MKLTVIAIKNALSRVKPYKLVDGGGLYLLVNPSGSKCWRFNYRYQRKYKTLAIGLFPQLSLKQARLAHQQAKQLLHQGRDPHYEKKIQKQLQQPLAEQTFYAIAQEWLAQQRQIWVDSHYCTGVI